MTSARYEHSTADSESSVIACCRHYYRYHWRLFIKMRRSRSMDSA